MCQPAPSIEFVEVTENRLELNQIKREPELLIKDEPEYQEWEHLEEKYKIKNEEIEIYDEKSNVFGHDFKGNLFNEKSISEYVEFENSNDGDLRNIKNTKQYKAVTENKTPDASRKVSKCTLCSYTAKNSCELKEHYKDVHSEIQSFGCPYCDYKAMRRSTLRSHICRKHEDETKMVKSRSNEVKAHKCSLCSYTADKISRIKEHFKDVHSEIRRFSCPHCDYAAKRGGTLNIHMLRKHKCKIETVGTSSKAKAPKKCTLCSYTAKNRSRVREHFNFVHLQKRSYGCPHCEYAAKQSSHLKRHIQSQHENKLLVLKTRFNVVKAHKCTLCSYTGKTYSRVKEHFNEVHSELRSFGCPHCDYKAKRKTDLKSHILRKHEDKIRIARTKSNMVKVHKCTFCSYTANNSSRITEHFKDVHAKNSSQIVEHFKDVHSEIRSFGCPDCDYAGKTGTDLKMHILRKHEDKTTRCSPIVSEAEENS